nr:hypothetical protein [Tanacetum cinerariifolium]
MNDVEKKGSIAPGKQKFKTYKARAVAHAIAFAAFVCALSSLVGLLLNAANAAAIVTITAATLNGYRCIQYWVGC